MSKSKVITLTIIGVLLAMSVLIGVSYSLWRITLTQETSNTLTTSCFDVTFTEDDNISLQNAYPLYDEDGKKLLKEFAKSRNLKFPKDYSIN